MAKFWWSFKKDENKIQWRSWAKLGVAKASGGLGFRELVSFNKALLAKQCWRMLTNPHSLAAKVLKDKYFRHSDILVSKLGFRPSVIWRSLWDSLELLKEGLVWRVAAEAKVKELIYGVTKTWKTDLVKEIFKEEEAILVGSLPISSSGKIEKMRRY
ncbi:hypothetical protein F2P56_001863 [Juglans regia]|uniref:Uncharacterized protein n=1 Tax=Juglans regia TaxID=51240 RepID=A0A834D4H7_JUGRE|nr:hypothetical protein F2P56_001863 [Juglans regia]